MEGNGARYRRNRQRADIASVIRLTFRATLGIPRARSSARATKTYCPQFLNDPSASVQGGQMLNTSQNNVENTASMRTSSERSLVHRIPIWALATIHVLGILGAPFAAKLHVFQPGATPHQNFHVVWEACKYATASLLALAIVLGPLARGERWALWVMAIASVVL